VTAQPGSPAAASPAANAASTAPQAAAAGGAGRQPAASSPAAKQRPDPQAVDDFVAKIAERESLDAAARARLADDLSQTDPALWPALMQYFQAAMAYRRQAEQKDTAGVDPRTASSAGTPLPLGMANAKASSTKETLLQPDSRGLSRPESSGRPPSLPSHAPERETWGRLSSLPSDASEQAAAESPPALLQDTAPRPTIDRVPQRPDSRMSMRGVAGEEGVVAASYVAPGGSVADQWPERLDAAIKLLESEARQSPQTSADVARQARLRLLYLAAGRRDDALRPLQSVSPAMQDSWSQMLYGLATWMDTERITDPARRAAETRQQLIAAANRLGEMAPLVVRNLSFAKEVRSFGDVVPFDKSEFTPGQEVLLYVELENFKSEETPKGFHTQFRGSYEVFDARGQRVTSQELGKTEETCRNRRRDFFLIYDLRLPKRIYSGKHTLKLTVEDLNRQEIGQASLDFTVKAGAE